jgi:hypothetical protein
VANWTTPRTWPDAYLVGASDLNQQVRDNLTALYDAQHDVAPPRTQTTPRTNWTATSISAAYGAGKFFTTDFEWESDGSTYVVEFFCPLVQRGTTSMSVVLIEGTTGTGITVLGVVSGANAPVFSKFYYTPISGLRSLNVVGVVDAGTGAFQCGNGGSTLTAYSPAYLRVTGAPI